MISKVKELKDVILNSQDVLIKADLIKRTSTLILDGLSAEDKAKYEEWSAVIVAVGKNVDVFSPGDIVIEFKSNRIDSRLLDENDSKSSRISVVHMNHIEIAVKPENYSNVSLEKDE